MSPARERITTATDGHPGAHFIIAVAEIALDRYDVIWVAQHGEVVAAIIPAARAREMITEEGSDG